MVVATAATCWGVAPPAALVVVAGTQSYDGGGLGGGDYPVTDLIQMLGRAGRPNVDDAGARLPTACVLSTPLPLAALAPGVQRKVEVARRVSL